MDEMYEKKTNWKWALMPIAVVAIAIVGYLVFKPVPNVNILTSSTTTTTEQVKMTTTGNTIKEERVTTFPTRMEILLDSSTRYVATMESDSPVGFTVWTPGENTWNIAGHPDTRGTSLQYNVYTDNGGNYVFEFLSDQATYADFKLVEVSKVG